MALKKPLVITNGQVEQLQSGDTLDAPQSGGDVITLTNANGGSIVIGQAVYASADDSVDLAQANAQGTVQVIGLVHDTSIASSTTGEIMTDGVLTATTGEWDAVTGGTGGLVFNTVYYLDPSTPGMLTDTAPTAVGEFVVRVGSALSTTEMKLEIEAPILL